jgi:hypothetical protein
MAQALAPTNPQAAQAAQAGPDGLPVLHLSGPALTGAMEALVSGSEDQGGIERYLEALALKVSLFQEAYADGTEAPDRDTFKYLCAYMAPVRRRIGPYLEGSAYFDLCDRIAALFDGAEDTSTADARIAAFCAHFPQDKAHRWVRDLAAELLHYTDPERYPLMCRWVWDARANSGVLREIWYGADQSHATIDIPDGYATFLMLRQELSQFLSDNGVFRNVPLFVDLLCAQIYAGYVVEQGGSFLRADFASPYDPMQHTRRLLGLDGVDARTGRTRVKAHAGAAPVTDID